MARRPYFFFVRVRGESMWPALIPGKRYLAARLPRLQVGDIVVAQVPGQDEPVIKYIKEQNGNMYIIEGSVSWASPFEVHKKDILGTLLVVYIKNRITLGTHRTDR